MEQIGSWHFFKVHAATGVWTSLQALEEAGKVVIEVVPIYEDHLAPARTGLTAVLIRALGG